MRAVHREREFTNYVTSTIFCGTYNVNAKVIADEDVNNLEEWLFGKDEPMADIYAVVSTTYFLCGICTTDGVANHVMYEPRHASRPILCCVHRMYMLHPQSKCHSLTLIPLPPAIPSSMTSQGFQEIDVLNTHA
jgi:hypothetical protein